jgi:hypothetical protein
LTPGIGAEYNIPGALSSLQLLVLLAEVHEVRPFVSFNPS